jgi:hypothetical protein
MKLYRISYLLLPAFAAIVFALAALLAPEAGAAGGTAHVSRTAVGEAGSLVPAGGTANVSRTAVGEAGSLVPAGGTANVSRTAVGEAGSLVPAGGTAHVSRTAVGEAGSLVPAGAREPRDGPGTGFAASGADPLLKDAGLTIVATSPVITTDLNKTLLIFNYPGPAAMRDAHLSLDFWSNDVLVAHLPFTLTLEPGPTVFPVTWASEAFSATYDAQARNVLRAQWTDPDDKVVDTATRALNTFGVDPMPSVALSDIVWDIGTITQGVVLNRAFTVANVGAADLAVYLSGPGTAQPYRRLAPGDMAAYTVTVDTLALPPLPYSNTLSIRTSDPAAPTRTIRIAGTIAAPAGPTSVFARPDRPWDRRLVVYGNAAENTPVYFSDITALDPAANEACAVFDSGGTSLKGVGRACLDPGGGAFGVVNGWRVLVERVDGALMRFSVPEVITGGAAYAMQFGRLYTFGEGAAAHTQPVRIISQTHAVATMDALVTNVGAWGALNLQVAVGNVTIYSQTQFITQPTIINLPNFASAIDQYSATLPPSRTADVPFQVLVDSAADVVLTNFTLVPLGMVDLSILPGSMAYGPPVTGYTLTEGVIAPVTTTVRNTGTTDSGPLVVSLYAAPGQAAGLPPQYIRSALVSNVPAGGSSAAAIEWNTAGVTGGVSVSVVADPLKRVAETNKANNSAEGFVNILTRPDVAVVRIVPSERWPSANEVVATSVVLRNAGQTDALNLTVALYDGDPSSSIDLLRLQSAGESPAGTALVDRRTVSIAAGAELTTSLAWAALRAGRRLLIAVVSADSTSSAPNGPNRQASLPVFVGFHGPILIDSGGANDSAYTATVGYGFLGEDGGVSSACGTVSYRTFRQAVSGPLQYRFDNFQAGRAYHLDLEFYECDGAGRQQRVLVNGTPVLASADLSDEQPHRFSLRLDPALYAHNIITLTIDEMHGRPAIVSQIHLYDVDYRYAGAGAPAEQPYPMGMGLLTPGQRGFGYLNGTPLLYDDAPVQAMRIETSTTDLRYRFDELDPARRYALNLTFYHRFELTPTLAIDLGTWYYSPAFTVPYSQTYAVNIAVPPGAYAADGSITVSISRTDSMTGSFVSEIALEEQTLGETLSAADLMLLTLDGPRTVTAGLPISYTLLVINNGPDDAGDVVLSAGPTPGSLRVAALASSGFCDTAGPISCSLGEFPNGASTAVTVVLTPTVAGLLNTPIRINSDTSDPNSANNSVLLSTQVLPAAAP